MKKFAAATAVILAMGVAPAALAEDMNVDGSVTAWIAGSDNALLSSTNEENDTLWGLKGDFTAGTKTEAGSFDLHGAASTTQFSDFDDESSFDWNIGADAGMAFDGGRFSVGVDYDDSTEDRHGVAARRDTKHPVDVATLSAYAGLAGRMDDVEVSARVDYATSNYDDAEHRVFLFNIDQDFRDRATWSESLRATVHPDADLSWFVEVSATQVDYDLKPPFSLHNRDSDGWSAILGFNVNMTDSVTGTASIGVSGRSFDEAGFKDVSDVVLNAKIDWKAGEDTDLSLSANRSYQETTQAFSSIYVSTSIRAQISHDFTDQVSMAAYAQEEWADHKGVDRDDEVTDLGVSLTYGFTDNAGLTVSWDHAQLNSDGLFAVSEYSENRWGAAVTLRF